MILLLKRRTKKCSLGDFLVVCELRLGPVEETEKMMMRQRKSEVEELKKEVVMEE